MWHAPPESASTLPIQGRSIRFAVAQVTVAVFLSTPLVGDENTPPRVEPADYTACGFTTLYAAAKIGERAVSFDQLQSLLPPGPEQQNSVAQLADAATKIGFFPVAVRLTTDQLFGVRSMAILHTRTHSQGEGSHFVLWVSPKGPQQGIVVDPPDLPRLVARRDLADWWTGTALLLCSSETEARETLHILEHDAASSFQLPLLLNGLFWLLLLLLVALVPFRRQDSGTRATVKRDPSGPVLGTAQNSLFVLVTAGLLIVPLAVGCNSSATVTGTNTPAAKADIEIPETALDIGMVPPSGVGVTLPISNPGTETLQINQVLSSCSCTVIGQLRAVEPKGKVELSIHINYAEPGPRAVRLTFLTNGQTPRKDFYVRVYGEAAPTLIPSAVHRRLAVDQAQVEDIVTIAYPGGDADQVLLIDSVETPGTALEAKVIKSSNTAKYSLAQASNLNPIVGEIQVLLRYRPSGAGSELHGEVRFHASLAGKRFDLNLPVHYSAPQPIEARPHSVVFSGRALEDLVGRRAEILVSIDPSIGAPIVTATPSFLNCEFESINPSSYRLKIAVKELPKETDRTSQLVIGGQKDRKAAVTIPIRVFAFP